MNNYSGKSKIQQFKLNEAKKRMYSGKGMTNSSSMGAMTNSTYSGMGSSLTSSTSVGQGEIQEAKQKMSNSSTTNTLR
ncbi:hypothetical protein PV797_04505 [Clostridiaceae bacterium M8S5]|nr:hypothetical protein PV797_04505 [Clostridiaceae bacterium M8S5]